MSIAMIISGREREVICCKADDTVRNAIAVLSERRIGAMPVVDNAGNVLGIFSERDVIRCLHVSGAEALDEPVSEAMTAPVVTVGPDTSENQALAMMTRRRIRHLPVIDGEKMVDFVSIGDLVKSRIDSIEAEANAMRDYIRSA